MAISVGAVNLLVNIGILLLAAIADNILGKAIANYIRAQLYRNGKAPAVHDSDTRLWYLPVSCFKYKRHPAVLTAIVVAMALVAAEILSEFGVDSSDKCTPVARTNPEGTCGTDFTGNSTDSEIAGVAFHIQRVAWTDDLTSIPKLAFYEGFPKDFTGKECLECDYGNAEPIVRGCTVKELPEPPGPNEVEIRTTEQAFGTITKSMWIEGRNISGMGDITCNGAESGYCSSFVVSTSYYDSQELDEDGVVYLLTYNNDSHIRQLLMDSRESKGSPIRVPTEGRITVVKIRCEKNGLAAKNFMRAVHTYRTMQLERTGDVYPLNSEGDGPKLIEAQDVALAVLGIKTIDQDSCDGVTMSYTSCGAYNTVFLAPLAGSISLAVVLLLISLTLVKGTVKYVPKNSRTYHAFLKYSGKQQSPIISKSSGDFTEGGESYSDWFSLSSYWKGSRDYVVLRECPQEPGEESTNYTLDFTELDDVCEPAQIEKAEPSIFQRVLRGFRRGSENRGTASVRDTRNGGDTRSAGSSTLPPI
mmetsp:Transcript_52999/g.129970  ORF Transcript_52999/g.129970 Transcript_52999/m.129970 type:complete len:530 (-) Transcript_52999:60-1649(-)